MINRQRIARFIQLLEAKGILTGRYNEASNRIEIITIADQRVIAERPISDFDDADVDLVTLAPSI